MNLSASLRPPIALIAVVLAVALALAGCASVPHDSRPVPGSNLTVQGVVARPGPEGGISGAFLTVVNSGAVADRLLAVRSPVAPTGELHETFDDDGVMRMRPAPDGFEVPAKGRLELKPGGKHVMFVGLNSPVKAGSQITLTLVFEKAGEVTLTAPVKQ